MFLLSINFQTGYLVPIENDKRAYFCCIFGSSWCIREIIFIFIFFIVSKNVLKIVPRREKANRGENFRYLSRLFSIGLNKIENNREPLLRKFFRFSSLLRKLQENKRNNLHICTNYDSKCYGRAPLIVLRLERDFWHKSC